MSAFFCETPGFTRRLTELLDDDAYRRLQNELREDPAKGAVMQGCGGIRKVRVQAPSRGRGKRGGLRVVYLHIPEAECIYFLAIYGKDEQDNLDADQRKQLRVLAERTRKAYRRRRRREED